MIEAQLPGLTDLLTDPQVVCTKVGGILLHKDLNTKAFSGFNFVEQRTHFGQPANCMLIQSCLNCTPSLCQLEYSGRVDLGE